MKCKEHQETRITALLLRYFALTNIAGYNLARDMIIRVGRGAGALWVRGAKKRRPRLGRGALQNLGSAEIQNTPSRGRS